MGLADLAKKVEKSAVDTKSKGIVLQVPKDNEPVESAHNQWVEAERELKDAQAKKEQAERVIQEFVEPQWLNSCRSVGRVENSIKFGAIRVTWKSKSQFLTKSSLDPQRLKDTFGEDYAKYFKEVPGALELNPEALANPDVYKAVEAALTAVSSKFPGVNILSQKTEIVPQDTIFNDYIMQAQTHDVIEAHLKKAGAVRTKTTFASR